MDVYLGQNDDDPEWLDVVVLTGQQTSQYLIDWLNQGCEQEVEGIPSSELEGKSIIEKDFVTVKTVN